MYRYGYHPYPQYPCMSSSCNTSDRINKSHKKELFCHGDLDKTDRNTSQISFSVSPLTSYFSNLQEGGGLPGGSASKELTCECRRRRDMGSIPGLGRSPREGNGNLLQDYYYYFFAPVFLLGKFHGQRSLASYRPRGHQRVRHD